MKKIQKRNIIRFSQGCFHQKEDNVAVEHPVTIKINDKEFMTIVCTPEFIEDMVIGFLASERVIGKYSEIKEIRVQEELGYVHIKTDKTYPFYENLQSKRYITSCCGMSRQGFVFANDALTAKKMTETRVTLTANECFALMEEMEKSAKLFQHTGGVHTASVWDGTCIVLTRMDIRRHTALY